MFQGELTPICLLPVNKMTLPPSDTVGRSGTNDSGQSSPGCSARPDG